MKTDKTVTISRSEFIDIASDEIATFADAMEKESGGKDRMLTIMMIDLLSTITTKIAMKMFKEDK